MRAWSTGFLFFFTLSATTCNSSCPGATSFKPTSHHLTVVHGGRVFAPEALGLCDVLLAGGKILSVVPGGYSSEMISMFAGLNATIVDAQGLAVTPGLVDVHEHLQGGGGENGFASRTPSARLSQLIDAGVTTAVGIMGTDSVGRTLETLLATARGLSEYGLTVLMWSGAYKVPPPTLTGSLQRDVILIDEVIGVGEVAISDHRSSWPTLEEIKRIVSDVRVAGMLAGKAGVAHFHVGKAPEMIDLLWNVSRTTTIPKSNMYPTHMNERGPALFEQGLAWMAEGGMMDLTADSDDDTLASDGLDVIKSKGLPLSGVSVSSDAYGSLPDFDEHGRLIGYGVASPDALLKTLRRLVHKLGWTLQDALQPFTSSPATFLKLHSKGAVSAGADADLLLLDESSLDVKYVWAGGNMLKNLTWTQHGMFE